MRSKFSCFCLLFAIAFLLFAGAPAWSDDGVIVPGQVGFVTGVSPGGNTVAISHYNIERVYQIGAIHATLPDVSPALIEPMTSAVFMIYQTAAGSAQASLNQFYIRSASPFTDANCRSQRIRDVC